MNKNVLKSKTVWGALLALVPGVGPVLAPVVMASWPADTPLPEVSPELQVLVAGIAAALTIYGRYKATGQIKFK